MLSGPDPHIGELSRRDPLVPGLEILLDADSLIDALKKKVPQVDFESARISYVKYKPGTNCLVGYQLQARGTSILAHAKSCAPHVLEKLEYWQRQRPVEGALGSGVHYLDEGSIALCVWPNDAKSATLSLLDNAGLQRQFLRRLLPRNEDLWDATLETLAYKPERRYVGCLSTDAGPQAVIKVYAKPGDEVRKETRPLSAEGEQLRLPMLLGRSQGRCAQAFRWAPGRLLSQALQEPQFDLRQMYAVGEALAELHSQNARSLPARSREMLNDELKVEAATLSMILPDLAQRAERCANTLSAELDTSHRQTATHGDFHARQILLSPNGVVVLDLDRARRASPLTDLASLAAALRREVVRGTLEAGRVEAAIEAFLSGYGESAGSFSAVEFNRYLAAELFRLSTRFFRYWEPDWPQRTIELLEQAEELLESRHSPAGDARHHPHAGQQASVPVTDPFGASEDNSMPCLHAALDPTVVQRQFERRLPEALTKARCRLLAIRVLRHKPGRRCLLAYDVELPGNDGQRVTSTLLGKVRAKGLDHRTFALMGALRKAGFDDQSADSVSVPQPLAAIPVLGMWLQQSVAGQTATKTLLRPDGAAWAGRLAEALFKLHRTSVATHRRHTIEDELKILRERLSQLAQQEPSWQEPLANIVTACHSLAALLPPCPATGIHRDFYPDQVLISSSRLYLLDLDLYCLGDPALDVGNFLAHLTELALRSHGDPDALADRQQAFEQRYYELAGFEHRRAVHIYRVLSLVRHIHLSTLFEDRRRLTLELMSRCQRDLSEALSGEKFCSQSGVEVDHVSAV